MFYPTYYKTDSGHDGASPSFQHPSVIWRSPIKLFLIFLLIIYTSCYSDIRIKDQPDLDGHSIGHLMEGVSYYSILRICEIKPALAITGAIGLCFLSELIRDGYQNDIVFKCDPGGADFKGDLLWGILGVGFGCILESAINNISIKQSADCTMIQFKLTLRG